MNEKENLQEALKNLIINKKDHPEEEGISVENIEKIFDRHIGFKNEKEKFATYVYYYSKTKGDFYPKREIICYAGAPGTGKTSFITTLKDAMGRESETISCSGSNGFKEYSVLGDENKPSLVAWAMEKTKCKNPIILLDELEKVQEGSEIQKELITLFKMYKNKGEDRSQKLFDKHYQMDIELDHVTFFATVNYPEKLSPLLKLEVNMRVLEDYSDEDKEKILKLKEKEIEKSLQKIYGNEIKDIIPREIIEELPKYIHESGIRQTERALRKIQEKYISDREKGKEFSLGNPKRWLKDNILPYQETFCPNWKHYCLFALWGIIWILLLSVIIKKLIIKKEKTHFPNNKIR